ncbi:MAG: hypothetical protein WDA01_01560 [Methanothrix sp.]
MTDDTHNRALAVSYFHTTSTSSVRYPGRTLDSARGVVTPAFSMTRPV